MFSFMEICLFPLVELLEYTNLTMVDDSAKVYAEDMQCFVGIMLE
jgi:hypothetical protein